MDTPLLLEEYFFSHVKVSADPGASGAENNNAPEFKTKVDVIKTKEDNGSYQVSLSISSYPESEEKRTAYTVELVAIGFFSVNAEWKDPMKLLEVTGASILYAAAREFLITITSRGPWGAIMLPTTSFLVMYNKKQESPTQGEGVKEKGQPSE